MKKNNQLACILSLISFVFLYPGITQPMLKMSLYGNVDASITKIGMNIFNKSSSIIDTIEELYVNGNLLVASLIFLFSVFIPFLKGVLVILCVSVKSHFQKKRIFSFVNKIGKWSQADVFVVAIFIAYLSTRMQPTNSSHNASVMGMKLKINVETVLNSQLEVGFYCFLFYCILSLVAMQLFSIENKDT